MGLLALVAIDDVRWRYVSSMTERALIPVPTDCIPERILIPVPADCPRITTQRERLLYSPASHQHIPSNDLDDSGLSPLTKWVQGEIYRRMHPDRCDGAKFVLSNSNKGSGLGSELHVIGSHLAYAIQNNLVLVWGEVSCTRFTDPSFCKSNKGCACLFQPTTHCPYDVIKANTVGVIEGQSERQVVPDIFRNAMRGSTMSESELLYWWRGQSVGYLARLNNETLAAVSALRMQADLHHYSRGSPLPFPLPAGTINAHVRHGDKHMEMPLVKSEVYFEAARKLVSLQPISLGNRTYFISSDSMPAIEANAQLAAGWGVVYSKIPRMTGGFVLSEWTANPERAAVHTHLLQLLMSLESDAWIGTRASNWNRLIDELRCVWVDKCMHTYVDVGFLADGDFYW